jgi:hypothetical protein
MKIYWCLWSDIQGLQFVVSAVRGQTRMVGQTRALRQTKRSRQTRMVGQTREAGLGIQRSGEKGVIFDFQPKPD